MNSFGLYPRRMSGLKKSPIYRIGNKEKLIEKLISLFPMPSTYNNFYDLFGGSGVVSMNILKPNENKYYNEYDKSIYFQVEMLKKSNHKKLIDLCLKVIIQNKLNNKDKNAFMTFRNKIISWDKSAKNWYKKAFYYFLISHYSFSNLLFIKKSMLTKGTTFGQRAFKKELVEQKLNYFTSFFPKHISNLSYELLEIKPNSFIYFDPPYLKTNSNYQVKDEWRAHDELKLLRYIEKLNSNGHKIALSNNKQRYLIKWAELNNFNIYNIRYNQTLGLHHKKDIANKSEEILITNYTPKSQKEQLKLF